MRPTHTPALAHALRRIPLRAVLLVGAALAFLIVGVTRDAGLLSRQHFNVRPVRLVLGTAAEMALLAWGVFLWSRILACFDGPQPRFRALLRVWCGSTLAKYLPGSIWSVAATAGMAREAGASPVALPSSFLLQGALNFVGAISLAALAQASAAWFVPHTPVWLVAALVIGALALVHPVVVSTLVRAGARAARRTAPEWHGSWPGGALLLALHVATWAAYGATFALFLSGIVPIGGVSWTHLAGINALAYTAGFLAFFAPAGLGVREAALVGLLVPLVPGLGARVAVAASSRLWLVLTEVAGGALIVGATTAHTRSTRRRYLTPVDGLPEERRLSAAADDVELLTDTRAALGVMTGACRGATRSIWIAQLAFDADCAPVPTGAEPTPQPLLDAILEAARRPRDHDAAVDVRIVLNGGLLLDTTPALRSAIAAAYDGTNVRVRALKAFPRVLHTKLLIVDERDAFLMGASFVNGYWDGARHVASGDPTATPGTGERPLHDVAVRVRGSTLPALSRWFLELWGDADRHTAHSDERDTTPDDVDPLDIDDAALASAARSFRTSTGTPFESCVPLRLAAQRVATGTRKFSTRIWRRSLARGSASISRVSTSARGRSPAPCATRSMRMPASS